MRRDKSKDVTGQEPFLPNVEPNIPGPDIFTEVGQDRLQSEAAKAIQNTLEGSKPDARAFGAGDFADADTIAKCRKRLKQIHLHQIVILIIQAMLQRRFRNCNRAGEGQALTNAQKATKGALDEFLKQVKPGIKPGEYADYIKEFGEATGLDISGDLILSKH